MNQQEQLTDEAEVRGTDVLEETTLFRLIESDWEIYYLCRGR